MKAELQGWCGSACAGKFLAGTVVAQARQLAPFRSSATLLLCAAAMHWPPSQFSVFRTLKKRGHSLAISFTGFSKKTKHTKIHQ